MAEWLCRKEFGNTPDISKALRLLVTEKNVKRAGKGGRAEPFMYQVPLHSNTSMHALCTTCSGVPSFSVLCMTMQSGRTLVITQPHMLVQQQYSTHLHCGVQLSAKAIKVVEENSVRKAADSTSQPEDLAATEEPAGFTSALPEEPLQTLGAVSFQSDPTAFSGFKPSASVPQEQSESKVSAAAPKQLVPPASLEEPLNAAQTNEVPSRLDLTVSSVLKPSILGQQEQSILEASATGTGQPAAADTTGPVTFSAQLSKPNPAASVHDAQSRPEASTPAQRQPAAPALIEEHAHALQSTHLLTAHAKEPVTSHTQQANIDPAAFLNLEAALPKSDPAASCHLEESCVPVLPPGSLSPAAHVPQASSNLPAGFSAVVQSLPKQDGLATAVESTEVHSFRPYRTERAVTHVEGKQSPGQKGVNMTCSIHAPKAAANTAVEAAHLTHTDSIMSNSPKESIASIAMPNALPVSSLEPHSKLGSPAVRAQNSINCSSTFRKSVTSSAAADPFIVHASADPYSRTLCCSSSTNPLGHSPSLNAAITSTGAPQPSTTYPHRNKENSPKAKILSAIQPHMSPSLGPAGKPNLVAHKAQSPLHASATGLVRRSPGRNSAASGTASDHALSTVNGDPDGKFLAAWIAAEQAAYRVVPNAAGDVLQDAEVYQQLVSVPAKRARLS